MLIKMLEYFIFKQQECLTFYNKEFLFKNMHLRNSITIAVKFFRKFIIYFIKSWKG